VRRIAQLASPFAPFPSEMAKQVDQIVLTRTWHFVDGTLQARQP
jgi:protein TonB